MDSTASPLCPSTVTIRRNPPRRARPTPIKASDSREIRPFPHDDISSAAQTPSTTSPPENENLKVFLRIRPILSPNQAPRARTKTAWPQNPIKKNVAAKKKSSAVCLSVNDSQSVTLSTPSSMQESKRIKSETYGGFTHVFSSDSSQCDVYERMVRPMVDEFLKGRSGMLAALGPSGSGKTHTVFGSARDPGMVPLTLRHIFKETEQHSKQASRSYYISIFEIYTERGKAEKLLDLLPNGSELSMQQSTVKGMQEVLISNVEQADSLITQAMLKRATAMTNTNSQSSRSQCIISIRDVPQKCKGVVNPKSNGAVLTIIDLAGAEREKRTGNQGTRLVESNFINNTLMVFGLCLRSLLEHQKNPKKPLQKHFQNSMLTRYLRDYLEGKKRMTLILTAKSGEDDYLDTSYLLRQASPYMQIKYNEVEPPNLVPNKRHYQASIMDNVKLSPSLQHKRVRLVGEHSVQNDEKDVEECNTSKEDASTVCKLDARSTVAFELECDHAQSERSHIIMQNFARVIWNCLKQYNSKLKVAEMEIQSLKKSIGDEKKKSLQLEKQLNEFKACCTCSKRGIEKTDTEDSSSVATPQLHNLDQEEMLHSKSSYENILNQSYEELTLGTSGTEVEVDFEKSNRELSVSLSKLGHHKALEVDSVSKISSETSHLEMSSERRFDQPDKESVLGTSCPVLDSENSDREVSISSSEPGHVEALEVDIVSNEPSETLHSKSSYENILDQSDEELTLGTSGTEVEVDFEKSNRELSVSLSKLGHHKALEVDSVSEISSETSHLETSSERRFDQPDKESVLGTSCPVLDSENSDREVSISSSEPGHLEALEVDIVRNKPCETLHSKSSYENILDQSDEELTLGTSGTEVEVDFEKSNRELSVSLSKLGHHKALEVDSVSEISSETSHLETSSERRFDQPDKESVLGTSCPVLDSENSDREVSISSSEPGHLEALEVDIVRNKPCETLHSKSSYENILDQSDEELTLGTSGTEVEVDFEKSNRELSVSLSKLGHHKALEVDSVSEISSETSHLETSSERRFDQPDKESVLGTSCPVLDSENSDREVSISSSEPGHLEALEVDIVSNKPCVDDPSGAKAGVNNSKPPRPKRTLVPSSSILSRDLSTFDLCAEPEKSKGNRSTRKVAAAHDPKRSNGSLSLLHLLQGRKSKNHL